MKTKDLQCYYKVEKIITRKYDGKNKLYLIKWSGFPLKDCTWEPISHLDKIKDLVENFDKNFPSSIDKRRLRKYSYIIHNKHKASSEIKNKNRIIIQIDNKINEIKNNHIIINLEESKITNEKINDDIKETSKSENTENNSIEETNDTNDLKLIKPIIIW